jgi:hypothetical protein
MASIPATPLYGRTLRAEQREPSLRHKLVAARLLRERHGGWDRSERRGRAEPGLYFMGKGLGTGDQGSGRIRKVVISR